MRKLSSKIISRALLYVRTLDVLIGKEKKTVSSAELADITGLTDVQIRKDISSFGKVGTPRVGYDTGELKKTLEDFILHKNVIKVALFGVGNLGTAILKYPGFGKQRLTIVAAFETNKKKIDKLINGVRVYALEKAPDILKKSRVDIGVIAVPSEYSQDAADLIVASGTKSIVNFAPVTLNVPKEVNIRDIDLSIEFLAAYCYNQ
ncbi:MAG: redox-sensing transcriptional repressor Rex [Candidatus Omnitrophota bacterium]